jgi:hypothetical protein
MSVARVKVRSADHGAESEEERMNRKEIERMQRGIDELRTAQPLIGDVYWGGANVVITPQPIPENPDAFYPPHRQFVTRHASDATWLFERLTDLLSPLIDFGSKFELYERLAAAGERWPEWNDMRNAILNEAANWMEEIVRENERAMRDTRIQ